MGWELLVAYVTAVADNAIWVVLAAGAAIAYVVVTSRREVALPAWAPRAALALVIAFALAWAWQLRWLADDAFISFRYAHNWASGRGLVFNVGERVEGYTNFLWVALLAGADAIGLDIPTVALVLCLAIHVGMLLLTARLVRQLAPDGRPVLVPLAAIVVATSYLAASFATGGLETTFGALLVLAAFDRARADRPLAAGALGIAATLAHPDHAIFYVALGVALASRRAGLRALAAYAAPFVVVFVPYFLARWSYYGHALPNTYYAKAGAGTYFSQGSFYLSASLVAAGLVGTLPLALYGVLRRRDTLPARFAVIAVPVYLLYVAAIGGDFMLGRLVVPVLPWLVGFAEVGLRDLVATHRVRLAAAAIAVASLACVPTRIIAAQDFAWFLSDERTFYRLASLRPLELEGSIFHRVAVLQKYYGDRQPGPVYAAYAIGILGWVTDWRVVDIHGLIDPDLARMPLDERGRPGHEHHASKSEIVLRGADLSAENVYEGRYDELTKLVLDGETYSLTRYRRDLLDPLRGNPAVHFEPFPEYLDRYLATIGPTKSREDRAHDLAFFDRYYFAGNPDPERRDRLRALQR